MSPRLLGTEFGSLRLSVPGAIRQMQQSMLQHGQLTPVLVYEAEADRFEMIDGFKRVRVARELELDLVVRLLEIDRVQAKAAIVNANTSSGLDEFEEAWLIRSLYREDDLNQPQIAQLLNRHKSWVSRRLLLAEHLDASVEADVRLGLINVTCARELARLPRVNQQEASKVVMRRGLTSRQTSHLAQSVLDKPEEERSSFLFRVLETGAPVSSARRSRSPLPLEALSNDVAALTRIAGRLQARLRERPLSSFGVSAAESVSATLNKLSSVLDALHQTITLVTGANNDQVGFEGGA